MRTYKFQSEKYGGSITLSTDGVSEGIRLFAEDRHNTMERIMALAAAIDPLHMSVGEDRVSGGHCGRLSQPNGFSSLIARLESQEYMTNEQRTEAMQTLGKVEKRDANAIVSGSQKRNGNAIQ